MNVGLVVALGLVLLLGLKTVLRSDAHRNQKMDQLNRGINVIIIPLIIVFLAIVVYKVSTLVGAIP